MRDFTSKAFNYENNTVYGSLQLQHLTRKINIVLTTSKHVGSCSI